MSSLPLHAYVCQDHFTNDQFELGRADHKRLLKWNAVPTIFSRYRTIKCKSLSEQEAAILVKHEFSDLSKKAATKENLKTEFKTREFKKNLKIEARTEVKENCKDNSDKVTALKCKLNASLREIHTLRTIIFQLQTIIEKLVEEHCMDET